MLPTGASGTDIALSQTRGSLTHTVTPTSATVGDRYRVQTPTAIARAIGTEFTTQYVQGRAPPAAR